MDCSLPGSSVRGISQARILKWLLLLPLGDLPNPGMELTCRSEKGLVHSSHQYVVSSCHPPSHIILHQEPKAVLFNYSVPKMWISHQTEEVISVYVCVCVCVCVCAHRHVWMVLQTAVRYEGAEKTVMIIKTISYHTLWITYTWSSTLRTFYTSSHSMLITAL